MSIKISELTLNATIDGTIIVPIVASTPDPTTYKTTVDNIGAYILTGNAASATKLASPVNINGIPFDGSSDISIGAYLPIASDTTLGGVKIGAGINIAVDGTISASLVKMFHGFSVNANGDLIYSTTQDTTINLQDAFGADLYEDTDIGTTDYSYSMDENGNLIVTFS